MNTRIGAEEWWEGQPLLPTFFPTREIVTPYHVIILSESFSRYERCLSDILETAAGRIRLFYPLSGLQEDFVNKSGDLLKHLCGEGFSESVYVLQERLFAYSNSRDGLSVIVVPKDVVSGANIALWDERFCRHARSGGIGFGDEGRRYLSLILEELREISVGAQKSRFGALIRCVHGPAVPRHR